MSSFENKKKMITCGKCEGRAAGLPNLCKGNLHLFSDKK
jgi:threonine dehydrogenase-like Zn-dependent dehydrogenase